MAPGRTPGQAAYEGYAAQAAWVSLISGAPLPSWQDQAPEIAACWEAAAAAVRADEEQDAAGG